jgi:hypothetical protein
VLRTLASFPLGLLAAEFVRAKSSRIAQDDACGLRQAVISGPRRVHATLRQMNGGALLGPGCGVPKSIPVMIAARARIEKYPSVADDTGTSAME